MPAVRVAPSVEHSRCDCGCDEKEAPCRDDRAAAAPARAWEDGNGSTQTWLLVENPAVQAAQFRARFNAELVVQDSPRLDVSFERVGLSPRAVEGQHQWAAQRLSQRMFGDERLELADQLAVATQLQVAVDPLR